MLFDSYRINTIIMPARNLSTGEMYTVVNYLVRDSQWYLLYADEVSLIFVRGDENADLVKRFSMSKMRAYNGVVLQLRP